MAIIRLTREDILQTKLVSNNDWYKCGVKEVKVKAAEKDQSTNYVLYCRVIEGTEEGVPVRCSFSEKFLGPFAGFAAACGADVDPSGGSFDTEAFVDKELYIFVEAKENPNDKKIYNTANGFMSVEAYEAMMANK